MLEIFIILIWLPIILIASYVISVVLNRNDLGPFNAIVRWLSFIGVVVHELCHYFISLAVGIRPRGISIKYSRRTSGIAAIEGYVDLGDKKPTFLQSLLISLAPLFVSTWLFFFCLELAINPEINPFFRIVAGFFCLSLFIGAAPSSQDFKVLGRSFKYNYRYTMYQIILVVLSGLFVLGLLIYYEITLWFNFIYYILVGIAYFALKYSFRGVNLLIRKLSVNGDVCDLKYKKYTRKRFKPAKPRKSGIREAQW